MVQLIPILLKKVILLKASSINNVNGINMRDVQSAYHSPYKV